MNKNTSVEMKKKIGFIFRQNVSATNIWKAGIEGKIKLYAVTKWYYMSIELQCNGNFSSVILKEIGKLIFEAPYFS